MSKFCVWNAANAGDVVKLEQLIVAHPHLIDTSKDSRTPMHVAAARGHVPAIILLFRMGSQAIDTPDKHGKTPMLVAALNGYPLVVETLVRLGSRALDISDEDGWTPALATSMHMGQGLAIYLALGAVSPPSRIGGKIIMWRPIKVERGFTSTVRFRVYFTYSLSSRLLLASERHQRISVFRRF